METGVLAKAGITLGGKQQHLTASDASKFGELDKLPIDYIVKRSNLGEKDWYYLETRVRG